MNFELGKDYIVSVTEKGIIPFIEFDSSQWFNKDYDDLDFLTDEEKIVVINEVLDKIRAEIENADAESFKNPDYHRGLLFALDIINKHIGDTHE